MGLADKVAGEIIKQLAHPLCIGPCCHKPCLSLSESIGGHHLHCPGYLLDIGDALYPAFNFPCALQSALTPLGKFLLVFLYGTDQPMSNFVVPSFLLLDFLAYSWIVLSHKYMEAVLKIFYLIHRDVVQIAIYTHKDDHCLLFYGHGLVLGLFEDFYEPLSSG